MTADEPRFCCDEMLQKLGRWLRTAGYDTAIATGGMPDSDLLALARAEGRILLTRDRKLAARDDGIALVSDRADEAARALRQRFDVDWLKAPFTRCLLDNAPLRPANPSEREALPPRARTIADAAEGTANACPACGRLYWPGSHVRRMQAVLERWAA